MSVGAAEVPGSPGFSTNVLDDIVHRLELRSSLYFRAQLSAPYAIDVPADGGRIRFHIAGAGRSWIGVEGGPSTYYDAGDLILVPHGASHRLADAAADTGLSLETALALDPVEHGVFRHGGGGPGAELVCGFFEFDETIVHPVIASLPPLVHVRADARREFSWMVPLLQAIEREHAMESPGGELVAQRLSEVLFVQVMRAVREQRPGALGALAGLGDIQLARALAAIHAEPEGRWTLGRLAATAGLSRTIFAERFRRAVGVTPMRYVATWRMQRARGFLDRSDLSVAEIGRRVGYDSEAAFSRAFRECTGAPPSRYRAARRVRETDPDDGASVTYVRADRTDVSDIESREVRRAMSPSAPRKRKRGFDQCEA